MRLKPDPSHRWQAFGRQTTIWVVVICSHLGLLALVLYARRPLWHDGHTPPEARPHVITLRFIEIAPPRLNVSRAPTPVTTLKPAPMRRHRVPLKIHSSAAPQHRLNAASNAPTTSPAQQSTNTEPGYIAGGDLLRGDDLDRSSRIRLPGSDVAVVPGLHMVDPRTQGVGGVARMLQHLLGVPDTHCVKVDAWRTLSTREMLARHLSPEQVQKIAEQYGCLPKA